MQAVDPDALDKALEWLPYHEREDRSNGMEFTLHQLTVPLPLMKSASNSASVSGTSCAWTPMTLRRQARNLCPARVRGPRRQPISLAVLARTLHFEVLPRVLARALPQRPAGLQLRVFRKIRTRVIPLPVSVSVCERQYFFLSRHPAQITWKHVAESDCGPRLPVRQCGIKVRDTADSLPIY